MYLYHYYDKRSGPFRSLTAVSPEEAERILARIRAERPDSQCAQRHAEYLTRRRNCEAILRREFRAKGGIMDIESPYYMVLGHSPWLSTWFEQGACLKIPVEAFDLRKVSFTSGDSMPTFSDRVNDGKEDRKKIYTYEEILEVIDRYGFPQDWNDDGAHGPERYIEAHVWTRDPIVRYMSAEE